MATGPPAAVVWEAHVSELIQRDTRWRQLWSTMRKACGIPDAAVSYPGHPSQRETKQGRAHAEELARCQQDPKPLADGLLELRQRVLGLRIGRRRARSSSTSFSFSSHSSSSTPPASDAGEDGEDGGWVLHKGRFLRRYGPDEQAQHQQLWGEEAHVRELLAALLQGASDGNNGGGGGKGRDVHPRGLTYYPPNGYRAWEKGSFDPADSWRLAIVHNIPAGRSLFRYRHPATGQVNKIEAQE